MSGKLRKLSVVHELDDADFRARLAPLATEVLPPSASRSPPQARRGGWVVVVLMAVSGVAMLAGAAWLGSRLTRFDWPITSGVAPPVDAVAGVSLAKPVAPEPVSSLQFGDGAVASRNDPAKPSIVEYAGTVTRAEPTPPRETGDDRLASRADPAVAVSPKKPALPPTTSSADEAKVATRRAEPDQDAAGAMTSLLLRRGDAALTDGDIIAARLLYERAAASGSARAATAAGKTYDAEFLLHAGARGIRADQTAAAAWFRKAAALGDPEARARLATIEGRPGP